MEIDIRKHAPVREQVSAGLSALKVQARQIWGAERMPLKGIVLRLMVGAGDIARLARDNHDTFPAIWGTGEPREELKKELGNVIFSTIRWIDDLELDVLECLDLAIAAQEKFAKSGRPR